VTANVVGASGALNSHEAMIVVPSIRADGAMFGAVFVVDMKPPPVVRPFVRASRRLDD
jgi:hypothetical protein